MARRLLVVHPLARFDSEGLTREAIRKLVSAYGPESFFVLYDLDGGAEKAYLGLGRLAHARYSYDGKVGGGFLSRLLEGCEELAICGHTGDVCHHTAFESVLGGYRDSSMESLAILLPTYAISSPRGHDTGKPIKECIDELERVARERAGCGDHGLPWQDHLITSATPREAATLAEMRQYLKSAAVDGFSFTVDIDGKTILERPGHKRLRLSIQNAPG